jgi:hypothetical protein
MFQRIQQYPLMSAGTRVYRPRAYAHPRTDGMYDGWLVFFPLDGELAIASDRETTQSSFDALVIWAAGLTDVYLAGALERAERIAEQPPVLATLARAEYEALEDAERLHAEAEVERLAATADEEAANVARADANEIRRERAAIEEELAAADEAAAEVAATHHEQAAQDFRAVAADASKKRKVAAQKKKAKKNRQ